MACLMNSPIFSTPPFLLDVAQHVECGFVGAAVGRAPEAGHTGRDGGEGVGAGGTAQAHRGGGGVLFVVGVQDEDAVQCTFEHGVDLVLFAGRAEHHAQEVAGVGQVILRVHVRLADAVLVGHGDQRGHLGNQADGRNIAVLRIVDVRAVVIEGRQGAHQAGQHGHGVGITTEAAQEELHLLVDHGVIGHEFVEGLLLRCIGQIAVEQQVAGVEVVALGGELLDGVAAVQQFALVAVDVGDGRLAGGRGQETRVVGEHAGLAIQLADVNDIRADIALVDRQLDAGRAVAERQGGFVVGKFHF